MIGRSRFEQHQSPHPKWDLYILHLSFLNICHIPIKVIEVLYFVFSVLEYLSHPHKSKWYRFILHLLYLNICQSSLKIIQVLYDVLMSCHIMMSYHLPAKGPRLNLFQFKEFWKRQSLRRKNCSALEPIDSMENSHSGEIFLLICGK